MVESYLEFSSKKLHRKYLTGFYIRLSEENLYEMAKKIFRNSHFLFRLYVGAPLSNVTGEGQGAVFFCRSNNLTCEAVTFVDTST